jgi:hypothetical protein
LQFVLEPGLLRERILGEVTTITAPQGMPSIENDPNARLGKPGSDHAALVATFDL